MTFPEIIDISVIIPAKNEARRLPFFLTGLMRLAAASEQNFEFIVVDDGSTDNTAAIVKSMAPVRVIRFDTNKGKGAAVKAGFAAARGNILVFMDADGATPPEEIEANLSYFDQGVDVVIGSRLLDDGTRQVEARVHRKLIGMVFNSMVRLFLFKIIQDTQCGFKMFRREVAEAIFADVRINRFGFDLEALYLANRLGFCIKEVPVNWHHVDGSRINLVTDALQMLVNIFQIRLWHGHKQPVPRGSCLRKDDSLQTL